MPLISEQDLQDLYSAGAAATKTSQNTELGLVLGMLVGTIARMAREHEAEIQSLERRIERLERPGFDPNRRLK